MPVGKIFSASSNCRVSKDVFECIQDVVDLGLAVVVHGSNADGAAKIENAQLPGYFDRIIVAVPGHLAFVTQVEPAVLEDPRQTLGPIVGHIFEVLVETPASCECAPARLGRCRPKK